MLNLLLRLLILLYIAELQDIRSISYLIYAARFGDRATRDVARIAIARTLPDLSIAGAEALSKDDRSYLYNQLLHGSEAIVKPILSVISHLGDTGAIPALKKLAARHAGTGGNFEVQLAADELLNLLIAKRSISTTERLLVRPSDPNHDAALTALRPASKSNSCTSSQLLRVSGGKSDDVERLT